MENETASSIFNEVIFHIKSVNSRKSSVVDSQHLGEKNIKMLHINFTRLQSYVSQECIIVESDVFRPIIAPMMKRNEKRGDRTAVPQKDLSEISLDYVIDG